MPTETAATWPCSGLAAIARRRTQRVHGVGERDVGAGDRGGARAAVGLQHVAIERDGALAERAQVDDRAQRTSDQALDLLRASALLAAGGLARGARVGGARQHAVLGRDPALALAAHERRHAFLDARGAQHAGVAELDQHRALGVAGEAAGDPDRAQLFGRAAAGSHGAALLGCRVSGRASARRRRWCCRRRAPCRSRRARRGSRARRAAPRSAPDAECRDLLVGQRRPTSHRNRAGRRRPAAARPAAERHLGQHRIAADAALDVIAHRVIVGLALGDPARAQQQFDVAVVARALEDRPARSW